MPKRLYYYLENLSEILFKERIEPCLFFSVSLSENPNLDWYPRRITFKGCEWFGNLHRVQYLKKIYRPKKSFGRLPEKEIVVVNQDGDVFGTEDIRGTKKIVHPLKQHEREWVSFETINFQMSDVEEIR